MNHKDIHAAVEFGDETVDGVAKANSAARIITASEAFRRYNWLKSMPVQNAAGNLRGMVLSPRWRGLYVLTIKGGAALERISMVSSVFLAMTSSYEEIDAIWQSSEPCGIKTAKLSTQATAIAMSVLTGPVVSSAHLAFKALQGCGYLLDLVEAKPVGTNGTVLTAMDFAIQSAGKQVSDGAEIYTYVETVINPKVSKMLGL